MEPGLRLKGIRERLGLRYREVEVASNLIAQSHRNPDFAIGLSRLADIENKGVVPNLHRLYSLCAIYRLDFSEALGWYGINMEEIWRDAAHVQPPRTHPLSMREPKRGSVVLPLQLDPGFDLEQTTYLSRAIQEWGKVPLSLLDTLNIEDYRYGVIGYDDYRMFPMLQPGALVQIDDSQTTIRESGWSSEFERPIYFLELRDGWACCWCGLSGDSLILQPHPSSQCAPEIVKYPDDVDVVGEVIGVAMQLKPARTRRKVRKKARSVAARG